jgi:hypothetical protein
MATFRNVQVARRTKRGGACYQFTKSQMGVTTMNKAPVTLRYLATGAAITALTAALTFSPAIADPGKGKAKGKDKIETVDERGRDDARLERGARFDGFTDRDRDIVRRYYQEGADCPPGLAKKNNGCLPPGQAKKRYEIGERLYDGIDVYEIPYALERQLPVLPSGYGYRYLDGDLGVIDLATLVVLDAIAF